MASPEPGEQGSRRSLLCALFRFALLLLFAGALLPGATTLAQEASLELSFVPTRGVQLAVWVEREDGTFMGTIALTYATATVGIGNRPGALQMNSGYRWPYGRREGVLPIWAHRRAAAPGARPFQRVIFQQRSSEGAASRTVSDQSVDEYYCLSFDQKKATRDALDAVTCASVFSSDKGRFLDEEDSERGYAEPYQTELGEMTMRVLSPESLYPPRRDVMRCQDGSQCFDHADVDAFAAHALEVMPELDAISRATPEAERRGSFSFSVPATWSKAENYVLFIEANTEGDYSDYYSPQRFPTPRGADDTLWDFFSKNYGYPYRGQPSVLYRIPFTLADGTFTTRTPVGYGALHGDDGEVRPLDDTIRDDPMAAPGSGADRLRDVDAVRAQLRVSSGDVCEQPDPPPSCGAACTGAAQDCGALACDLASGTCQSPCRATEKAGAVGSLRVTRHPNQLRAHMWARMSFRAPESERPVGSYEVKLRPTAGGEWMMAFAPDSTQELLPVALDICSDAKAPQQNRCLAMRPGTEIRVDLAGLRESTAYEISVTPRDALCGQLGKSALATFETAERTFTTVSPCFIATAAYGSPLANEVGSLRRLRDRYLAPHALGRALIAGYYELGPVLAGYIREHEWLRSLARALIAPVAAVARWSNAP